MFALEAQVKQLGFQAAQDCERLTKDKTLTLQLLHKVREPEDADRDGDSVCGNVNLANHNVFSGTGKAVHSGEQVPSFNRRAELHKAPQQHPGGEQNTSTCNPRKCSSLQLL